MSADLTSLIAARDLREQITHTGVRIARVGWGQIPVSDKHKHDEGEMQALPAPILMLASPGLEGLRHLVVMMSMDEKLGVGIRIRLVDESTCRFEILWQLPSKKKFEVFQKGETRSMSTDRGRNVEDMTRFYEYAKLSGKFLLNLIDSLKGVGTSTLFEKADSNPSAKVFTYYRCALPVPSVMNLT